MIDLSQWMSMTFVTQAKAITCQIQKTAKQKRIMFPSEKKIRERVHKNLFKLFIFSFFCFPLACLFNINTNIFLIISVFVSIHRFCVFQNKCIELIVVKWLQMSDPLLSSLNHLLPHLPVIVGVITSVRAARINQKNITNLWVFGCETCHCLTQKLCETLINCVFLSVMNWSVYNVDIIYFWSHINCTHSLFRQKSSFLLLKGPKHFIINDDVMFSQIFVYIYVN